MDHDANRRRHILVVDDDDAICRLVQRALAGEHDVSTACDGQDALERFQRGERFDLVLCDVMMPRLTGPELHAALLALAEDQAKRMVFFTASVLPDELERVLGGIPNAVLRKPISLPVLREFVRALLI
jgi:CheY-like chemotaxis protein